MVIFFSNKLLLLLLAGGDQKEGGGEFLSSRSEKKKGHGPVLRARWLFFSLCVCFSLARARMLPKSNGGGFTKEGVRR